MLWKYPQDPVSLYIVAEEINIGNRNPHHNISKYYAIKTVFAFLLFFNILKILLYLNIKSFFSFCEKAFHFFLFLFVKFPQNLSDKGVREGLKREVA